MKVRQSKGLNKRTHGANSKDYMSIGVVTAKKARHKRKQFQKRWNAYLVRIGL